jgi:hypothetical protein
LYLGSCRWIFQQCKQSFFKISSTLCSLFCITFGKYTFQHVLKAQTGLCPLIASRVHDYIGIWSAIAKLIWGKNKSFFEAPRCRQKKIRQKGDPIIAICHGDKIKHNSSQPSSRMNTFVLWGVGEKVECKSQTRLGANSSWKF